MTRKIPCQDRLFLPYSLLLAIWCRVGTCSDGAAQGWRGCIHSCQLAPPPCPHLLPRAPMDLRALRYWFNRVSHYNCLHTSLFFLPTSTSPLFISCPRLLLQGQEQHIFHIPLLSLYLPSHRAWRSLLQLYHFRLLPEQVMWLEILFLHRFWANHNFLLQNQTSEFKRYAFKTLNLYFKFVITLHP